MERKQNKRSIEEIQADYACKCMELGELTYKLEQMPKESKRLQLELAKLNLEAASVKNG